MEISLKDWKNYIDKLSQLSAKAGASMQAYVDKYGFSDRKALIDYAHALVVKYGEGSAALACLMYDAIAEFEGLFLPAAMPADVLTYNETARAINGALKQSPSGQLLDSTVQRMVKQAGADTTLQNAVRDNARFAWVTQGDTCPYCMMISAIGWQNANTRTLADNKHAQHIHGNCDCQYVVDFKGDLKVSGYDPDKLKENILSNVDFERYAYKGEKIEDYRDLTTVYNDFLAENGKKSKRGNRNGLNELRRMDYAKNKESINEKKREAYAIRVGKEEVN